MTDPYPLPDTSGDMRRIGTTDPDGDTLNFTFDESTNTVKVEGTLRKDAVLEAIGTNPGKGNRKGILSALLADVHKDMIKHNQPCRVKIEFKFAGGKNHKKVIWTCSANASWVERVST